MNTQKKRAAPTAFGKLTKYRLIDLGHTQEWLCAQIRKKTGLFVDSAYLSKILTGQRAAPKIVDAIREVLGMEGG